jgi:hypothetical protein
MRCESKQNMCQISKVINRANNLCGFMTPTPASLLTTGKNSVYYGSKFLKIDGFDFSGL